MRMAADPRTPAPERDTAVRRAAEYEAAQRKAAQRPRQQAPDPDSFRTDPWTVFDPDSFTWESLFSRRWGQQPPRPSLVVSPDAAEVARYGAAASSPLPRMIHIPTAGEIEAVVMNRAVGKACPTCRPTQAPGQRVPRCSTLVPAVAGRPVPAATITCCRCSNTGTLLRGLIASRFTRPTRCPTCGRFLGSHARQIDDLAHHHPLRRGLVGPIAIGHARGRVA